MQFAGGCYCGQVRYQSEGWPFTAVRNRNSTRYLRAFQQSILLVKMGFSEER